MIIGAVLGVAYLSELAATAFIESLSKRLVSTLIDETTSRAKTAMANVGTDLLGKLSFWDAGELDGDPLDQAASLTTLVQQIVSDSMAEVGVTLVKTDELQALLDLAAAADGKGDLKHALETWKNLCRNR